MSKSIAFFTDTLGFRVDWGDASSTVCSVSRDGKPIMLREVPAISPPHGFGLVSRTPRYSGFQGRGVKVLQPPKNYSWAYEMKFRDIDGNVLWLGAESKVNLPFEDA